MDAVSKRVRKSIRGNKLFLPDEIITNILSRLPAKSAMRFRLVCNGWRDLTFDPDFVELHLRNTSPTILVANFNYPLGLEILALDKWWESERTVFRIHRFRPYSAKFSIRSCALFSHAGLLVVHDTTYHKELSSFIVSNLASHEHVRITLDEKISESKIYGVYYHPSLKEYCCLLKICSSRIRYKILNLGFNPSLKRVGNPFKKRVERENAKPLLINNYLYWLLRSKQVYRYSDGHNDIMEFDTIKEEFKVLPCPVPLNIECTEDQTCLLYNDGMLCYLLAFPTKITIWRLESDKFWKSVEYALSIENCPKVLKGIAIEDGMLALEDGRGRLLVCNLMEGNVKDYPYPKKNNNMGVSFLSHHISLASLENCNPLITIGKDGEVVV